MLQLTAWIGSRDAILDLICEAQQCFEVRCARDQTQRFLATCTTCHAGRGAAVNDRGDQPIADTCPCKGPRRLPCVQSGCSSMADCRLESVYDHD